MIFGLNVIIHMYDISYLRDRMIITNQPGLDSHRWLSLSLSDDNYDPEILKPGEMTCYWM